MWWHVACEALTQKRCLQISYSGLSRIVEVHMVGTDKSGDAVMSVYQVRGGSVSQKGPGFRFMKLDKAWAYTITQELSQAPRVGYNPNDPKIPFPRCKV